jgi:hypothetical protein
VSSFTEKLFQGASSGNTIATHHPRRNEHFNGPDPEMIVRLLEKGPSVTIELEAFVDHLYKSYKSWVMRLYLVSYTIFAGTVPSISSVLKGSSIALSGFSVQKTPLNCA